MKISVIEVKGVITENWPGGRRDVPARKLGCGCQSTGTED